MGTGHVTFFYNKIGFNVKELTTEDVLEGMPPHLVRGYTPTAEAVEISLKERLLEIGYDV